MPKKSVDSALSSLEAASVSYRDQSSSWFIIYIGYIILKLWDQILCINSDKAVSDNLLSF